MRWLWKLTGGRPMTFVNFRFTDVVNGLPVHHFHDRLGRDWLAHGRWSLFRVGINPTVD